MTWLKSVNAMPANNEDHVRFVVVHSRQEFREEQPE